MNSLSRREEDNLLKATKSFAMKEPCQPLVKDFADCMSGRLISVAWACKDKLRLVEKCMIQYTGQDSMDQIRTEYLKMRNEKQAEKQHAFDQATPS